MASDLALSKFTLPIYHKFMSDIDLQSDKLDKFIGLYVLLFRYITY